MKSFMNPLVLLSMVSFYAVSAAQESLKQPRLFNFCANQEGKNTDAEQKCKALKESFKLLELTSWCIAHKALLESNDKIACFVCNSSVEKKDLRGHQIRIVDIMLQEAFTIIDYMDLGSPQETYEVLKEFKTFTDAQR